MAITIKVTQEDIDKGKRANCFACPIALASMRAFGLPLDAGHVEAYGLFIGSFVNGGEYIRYHTPIETIRFMNDFDQGLLVSPFEFELTELY